MSAHETDHGGCGDRHDDLAAYALGALPPAEAAALEQHLAGCEACRERLAWLKPAVDLVPASVPQMQPPPGLKQDLMATVRAEAVEAEAAEPRPAPARAEEGFGAKVRRRFFGEGSLRPALAGFAVFCVVVAGVVGYELRGQSGSTDVAEYAALPTSPKVSAHGTVSVEDGSGTLVVENMADIPQDEVYQLWIEHDGQVSPSEIFVVDHDGHGSATIPTMPADAERLMVTREPAGGSEEPRSAPVLVAEM
jgi:anti-sigma factor RsiW